MKLKELQEAIDNMNEMALRNTELIGDFTKDGSFYGPDRKIHLGKNRISQLKHFFKNTEVDFNILFLNCPNIPENSSIINGTMLRSKAELRSYLESERHYATSDETISQIQKSFSSKEINILITHNEGDEVVPLSPWIVAHRASHVLASAFSEYERDFLELVVPALREVFYAVFLNDKKPMSFWSNSPNISMWLHLLANQLGTMHSAKTEKFVMGRGGEILHEWFAQYILDGEVTLNRTDFKPCASDYGHRFTVRPNYDTYQILELENVLNLMFNKVLKQSKGKYYVL